MQIPSYGAAPLSATFLIVRVLQVISMICIVGMTANFINEIVMANHEPPREIVGTITITAMATLYTLVSIAFFWASANVGLFVMTGIDFLLLIAFIVVAVTIGKPISYLNCYQVGAFADVNKVSAGNAAYEMVQTIKEAWNEFGSKFPLMFWAGMNKTNCFETKAIWGFSIALCILFTTSCVLLPTLFLKQKKVGGPPKDFA